jgi:lipopolysaccharide heptosyltransferase II
MANQNFKNILLLRQSALGDVANVLPFLQVVREAYPDAKLTFLTGSATASLLTDDPCIDDVLVWDRTWRLDLLLPMLWRLHQAHFDLVIDLHCSRYSRWLVKATAAPMRIGAHYPGSYTHLVSFDLRNTQISEIFRCFLLPLGLESAPYVARFPQLALARESAEAFLADHDLAGHDYVVFNPGHSPAWGTKRWPVEYWTALGQTIVSQRRKVVVTGGGGDAPLAEQIVAGIGAGAVSAAGKTNLACLAGLMSLSGAVVSTDSGPMHVAAMAGAKVVALFGPTHPVTSAPFGEGHKVMHHKLHCSYCFKKVCPYAHECLDLMLPDEVWVAVREILDAAQGKGDDVA